MTRLETRRHLIRWLYVVGTIHLLVGISLPWTAGASLLNAYHGAIEAAFWQTAPPEQARSLQTWWIALFGPTLQAMSLWMMVLIQIAERQRDHRIWLWLIAGLVIWAPQDMLVSLRAQCWIHVWIDSIALIAMVPPLFWLYRNDKTSPLLHPETHQPSNNLAAEITQ